MELARTLDWLARAESKIALLERTRPIGLTQEMGRLREAWAAGHEVVPMLRYARRTDLTAVKAGLTDIIEGRDRLATDRDWIAARAEELRLEAELAETVGQPEFRELSSRRYPLPSGDLPNRCESLALKWVQAAVARPCCEPTYVAEDRSAKESLWSLLSARLGELRVPVRLRVEPALVSVAACGEDFIAIRGGARLTHLAARRITEHEVVGHLLPRLAARGRSDVLRCGCAGAGDDEEGRALLVEQRLALMDRWRRAELGTRHLACCALRRGASFVDVVRELGKIGAPTASALAATFRAFRGGGLAREIIYLPALLRLADAFAEAPELEQWFELGRASLAYAKYKGAGIRAA